MLPGARRSGPASPAQAAPSQQSTIHTAQPGTRGFTHLTLLDDVVDHPHCQALCSDHLVQWLVLRTGAHRQPYSHTQQICIQPTPSTTPWHEEAHVCQQLQVHRGPGILTAHRWASYPIPAVPSTLAICALAQPLVGPMAPAECPQPSHLHVCTRLPVLLQCCDEPCLQYPAEVVVRQVLALQHGLRPHLDALTLALLKALARGTREGATEGLCWKSGVQYVHVCGLPAKLRSGVQSNCFAKAAC